MCFLDCICLNREMLITARRLEHAPFGSHLLDDTLAAYASHTVALIATLLRGASTQGFRLNSTAILRARLEELRTALNEPKSLGPIANGVHAVLLELWTNAWEPASGCHIVDPTMQWIALHLLRPDGSFNTPANLTGVLAKFSYFIRLTLAGTILLKTHDEDGQRVMDDMVVFATVKGFCRVGVESTFNSVRSLQHLASAISYLTMGLPHVWWVDGEGFTQMLYKGERVDLDQLRLLVAEMERDLVRIWEDEVLMGLKVHVDWSQAVDDMSNREVGYSCLSNPKNKCFEEKNMLGTLILNTPHLRQRFCPGYDGNTGEAIWNVQSMDVWLRDPLRRFNRKSASLTDLTSGSPIRISELGALLYRNTQGRPMRSLAILNPYVALIRHFNKQSSMRGYDKTIPHALSAVMGDILLQSIAITRDFAVFAAGKVWGPDSAQVRLYQTRVFVDYDRAMSSDAVTTTLHHASYPILNWKMGVADVRQIMLAYGRHHCRRIDSLMDEDEGEGIRGAQAGHSVNTGRAQYGVSDRVWGTIAVAEEIIPKFLEYSTDAQRMMHTVPGTCFSYVSGQIRVQRLCRRKIHALLGCRGQMAR